ncbi:hypothetical protein [Hydrogenophaga sp.]|uniref:hypothetical protein n=1 Tax=Hydrogenophaga sp. TaxID=1904254 RepID=UPI00272F1B0F|nr:hypothetical protein [Hydrogenophaga sp.]MDP2018687.1 hypothetical protein [Hydrogenophaga sp.]MDP3164648.1 hypothetical protein [Hydrogenophaga sp.]MDP3810166.1 hypothetical protein [Hydrogenophaga sp.]
MKRETRSSTTHHAVSACLALLCVAEMASAHAWSLNITSGSRRLFLHVGNGALSGSAGTMNGTAGTSGAINLVEVSVPVALLGNGTALAMTSNSTQSTSLYGDGNNTCPTPASALMIGAGYRRNSGAANATLTVNSSTSLTNGSDTIPFTEISWTVSAPGSGVPNVIPAGTFNGGTQTLATVPGNTYLENCHTYSYANSAVRPAGTYNGRVTYTLSSP